MPRTSIADLLIVVGAMRAEINNLKAASAAPAPSDAPVVHLKQQPDTWLPRLDVVESMQRRPAIAVFADRDEAFAFRNAEAKAYPQRTYCVGDWARAPSGDAVCCVY